MIDKALDKVLDKVFDKAGLSTGTWSTTDTKYGYDFWYQPKFDVMISSEWGAPRAFKRGLDPSVLADSKCLSQITLDNTLSLNNLLILQTTATPSISGPGRKRSWFKP